MTMPLSAKALRSGRAGYRVESIEGRAAFDTLRDEWNALLESGPADMPFLRHEWMAAWLSAFAPDRRLRILVARDASGAAAGMAPFLEERGLGLTRLCAPANDHSCRFEWVLGPDPAGAVAALWGALRDLSWDVLLLRDLPRHGPTSTHLGRFAEAQGFPLGRWESQRSPYLLLGGRPVDDRVNAKFRANLHRRARRLAEKGEVTRASIGGTEGLEPALERFFALEAAGWKGKRGTAIARSRALLGFYREAARAAARAGWLSIRSLELAGQPVAMHYAFTYRGRYWLLKPAYDERFASCSPGQLLFRGVVSECESRALTEIDFLGPDMPWKQDWEPLFRPHDWLYVYRPGPAGRALHAWKHRLRPLAREVLSWWR